MACWIFLGPGMLVVIAHSKVAEVIEYQDSRCSVTYAGELYETIANQVAQEQPEVHEVIETNMAEEEMKAWPLATAPATPVMLPEQVSQQI